MVHDLRALPRRAEGWAADPSAVILAGRTAQGAPEGAARAGDEGFRRRKGSQTQAAIDTLGHLLALHVTPANERERDRVAVPPASVRAATGDHVEVAFVDGGGTGEEPAAAAEAHGLRMGVDKGLE